MSLLSKHDQRQIVILRKRALRKQRGLCYWCGQPTSDSFPANHPRRLTGDHLVPLFEGGKTVPGNIVAACRECNNGRHSYTNRSRGKVDSVVASAGDKTVHSPFAKLRTTN